MYVATPLWHKEHTVAIATQGEQTMILKGI